MVTTAYINGRVLADGRFRDDLSVVTNGARIARVQPGSEFPDDSARIVDLAGDFLLPGFIDVQVNGGGGVLFNDQPTVDGIRTIAQAHRPFGTAGLMPTLISDDLDVVHRGLAAVEQAIREGVPGVLGIHIEGPFLNEARRGVHDPAKLSRLTREIVDELEPLPNGRTMLTLAPETAPPNFIRQLADKGFIVCGGHSDARQEEVQQALRNGMRGFTHLFNAMSQLTAREPGMVGRALADEDSWCGIIADGHHVAPASLRVAWRCKGAQRLMLVTDAMPCVGSSDPSFLLQGNRISVENGICVDGEGTLAGTAIDMAAAVRTMAELSGCSFADACTMASSTPAEFLGVGDQRGSIEEGHFADLVIMDSEKQVKQTLIAGA